jgi:hypothetical protein
MRRTEAVKLQVPGVDLALELAQVATRVDKGTIFHAQCSGVEHAFSL